MGFVSASFADDNTGGTTLTIDVPESVVDGNLLVLAATNPSTIPFPINALDGWTTSAWEYNMTVFRRIASSEPASYTLTWKQPENNRMAAICAVSATGFTASSVVEMDENPYIPPWSGTHADVDVVANTGSLTNKYVIYAADLRYGGSPFQFGSDVTWTADPNTDYRGQVGNPAGGSYDVSLALFTEYIASSADHPLRQFDGDWTPNDYSHSWRVARILFIDGGGPLSDTWTWM